MPEYCVTGGTSVPSETSFHRAATERDKSGYA